MVAYQHLRNAIDSTLDSSHATGGIVDPHAYMEVRRGFEEFLRVNMEETGLMSQAEAAKQWKYVEEAAYDAEKFKQAREAYVGHFAEKTNKANLDVYHKEFIKPLDDALEAQVISSESYGEWIKWIRDPMREAKDKKASIKSALPGYLSERWGLAKERHELLGQARQVKDIPSDLQKDINDLQNDQTYFSSLSFTQRKGLVGKVSARLAVMEGGDEYKKLHDKAKTILKEASTGSLPALHRDKVGVWLARIFKSGASAEEIKKFIDGSDSKSLKGLIKTWRKAYADFRIVRDDPGFEGVKSEFISTKAFLWMNYKDRVKYIGEMRGKATEARALKAEAKSRIGAAQFALDSGGADKWLNRYVFNGEHTLSQLESIVRGNMSKRLDEKVKVYRRFQKAHAQAREKKGLRGMPMPEKSGFLKLHYDKQLATVKEMEMRLESFEHGRPDFLVIRNAMDRSDWDDAADFIAEARKLAELTDSDRLQLDSMEDYIKRHRKGSDTEKEKIETTQSEAKQIDQLIDSLPVNLQDLMLIISSYGAQAVRMFGWGMYNREWCYKNGYLNPEREEYALRTGKQAAMNHERRKKKKVVSETIQGETGEEEFIELSRSAATNVCLDISDTGAKGAMARTVHQRQGDHRAWYWTNIILHQGGSIISMQREKEYTQKIYQIGRLMRTLEAKGQHYSYKGTSAALKNKAELSMTNKQRAKKGGELAQAA